jgi:hypothetical protein
MNKKNKTNTESHFEKLVSSIDQQFLALKKLSEETKALKIEDTKLMIKHYIGMTDAIETRRIRANDQALQILALSITGLGILFSGKLSFPVDSELLMKINVTIVSVLVSQIIFSLVITLTFFLQTNFDYYPFQQYPQYGNKWKWFFYGNPEIKRIDTNPYIQSHSFENTTEPYLNGLVYYANNYVKEDIDTELKDNIQQLYLLQVHNYYKNRFFNKLTTIQQYSTFFTVLLIICGTIWMLT